MKNKLWFNRLLRRIIILQNLINSSLNFIDKYNGDNMMRLNHYQAVKLKENEILFLKTTLAKTHVSLNKSDLDWWNAKTDVTENGILFSLKNNGITSEILVTWEELNGN